MGLCCSKLFNRKCTNYQPLIHPAQPVYFNISQHNRPPPYNPSSFQFNDER